MTCVIIDYGSGNLRSAEKSFQRMAGDIIVSADPDVVRRADRVVLPGVGAFADCRAGVSGVEAALKDAVLTRGVPFLGICVGMQLMASHGEEGKGADGFGWIPGGVRAIPDTGLKIPHMGWNALTVETAHPVFDGITTGDHAYFVHSYHLEAEQPSDVIAVVDYGVPVTAAVAKDNMVGTQFHPEKSQATGLRLIQNFLNWKV